MSIALAPNVNPVDRRRERWQHHAYDHYGDLHISQTTSIKVNATCSDVHGDS